MKLAVIVGARPQFIKAAPLFRAIAKRPRVRATLVHTGQHYDERMSDVFFRELELPEPDFHLGVGSGPHGRQTGEMLGRTEEVLAELRPDCALVFGDTNTTLAGALAAAKLGLPVAHVEAGLRSFDRSMPEEINRVVADRLSSFLFCPTRAAVENLAKEGIVRGVHRVGDIMLDALLQILPSAESRSRILADLGLEPKGYVLATIHRASSTDVAENLLRLLQALTELARQGNLVVFPVHPRTRKAVEALPGKPAWPSGLRMIPPVSYRDMLVLEKQARCILTDSGGVQKEAFWLRVPCVTLREETEWVETVESGWNRLAGTDSETILRAVRDASPGAPNPAEDYGGGRAAESILDVIARDSD